MMTNKPDNVIDGAEEAVMFYMGGDWVIRIFPFGGSQLIKMANEKDLLRLPRVKSKYEQ